MTRHDIKIKYASKIRERLSWVDVANFQALFLEIHWSRFGSQWSIARKSKIVEIGFDIFENLRSKNIVFHIRILFSITSLHRSRSNTQ